MDGCGWSAIGQSTEIQGFHTKAQLDIMQKKKGNFILTERVAVLFWPVAGADFHLVLQPKLWQQRFSFFYVREEW